MKVDSVLRTDNIWSDSGQWLVLVTGCPAQTPGHDLNIDLSPGEPLHPQQCNDDVDDDWKHLINNRMMIKLTERRF